MQDEPRESPQSHPGVTPAPANPPPHNQPKDETEAAASPAWANDLRKLYNAVVEEPLPDSLIDLLSQLDAED